MSLVNTPDGPTFVCIRGGRAKPKPGHVLCPLNNCSWEGKATEVVDHLADKHGRHYERG